MTSWLRMYESGLPKKSTAVLRAIAQLLDERAAAVGHRPERLVGRDRRTDLVVVVRALRLGRLLHLHEVRVVDLAAVGADRSLAEERVIGRHLLHLCDHLRAVV